MTSETEKERERGRKLHIRLSCNERCGERRVLFGGVTKFHERVSPLQPVFARECEKEETLARVRERNVLGSARSLTPARERESEKDRRRDGEANQSGRRRKTYRVRGKKTEAVRR